MEQHFIAVTEKAPRLRELEEKLATEFLRDYDSYENRVENAADVVPMRRCLEMDDLEELLVATEDKLRLAPPVAEGAPAEGGVAAAIAAEDNEDESDGDTIPEDDEVVYVRLSNPHIVAMLITYLGPEDVTAAAELFEGIKMKKEPIPFSSRAHATHYLREWKNMERWCGQHLPKSKFLIKKFIWGIFPTKLAKNLDIMGYKRLAEVKTEFLRSFNQSCKARATLMRSGGMSEEKKNVGGSSGKTTEPVKTFTPSGGNSHTAVGSMPKPSGSVNKEHKKTDMKDKVCYHCNQPGHIRPECPLRTPAAAGQAKATPKFGSMSTGRRRTPVVLMETIDGLLKGSRDPGPNSIRIKTQFDTGAELNLCPANWVAMLQLAGATMRELPTPLEVGWVEKIGGGYNSTFQVERIMEVCVRVVGFNYQNIIEFYVAPDHMALERMVCGWPTLQDWHILESLDTILLVQREFPEIASLPVSEGTDGNIIFNDIDERMVATDDLLWVNEGKVLEDKLKEVPNIGDGIFREGEKIELNRILVEYANVFDEEIVPGGAKVEPMRINMSEEWNPDKLLPIRHYSPTVEAAMQFELQKQLADGIVEASDARSGAPVLMVKKENSESGFRFCVDFTERNKYVVTEHFPLPTVQTILDSASGAKFFAKLDLRSGYWQFPVHPDDRHKLSFQVQGKVYQYRTVAMGHVQSSYHVQKVMNSLFAKYIGHGVFVYLDDIIIYCKEFDEFCTVLRDVLSILHECGFKCRGSKCEVGTKEVMCLGHVLSAEGVRMSESRIAAVTAIPFPRSAKELRRYLGMVNYMRRHIPNLSVLTKPLSARVNEPVALWPLEEMQVAFNVVQEAVRGQVNLAHLRYDQTIVVTTDASVLGCGGSVSNRYVDEEGETCTRVVALASHAFTDAESRWKTIEQEGFGVVWMVQTHRCVLWGHPFILETDHRNLLFIHGGTSAKVTRWSLSLQNFDYILRHVAGVENVVTDTLSRAPVALLDSAIEAPTLDDFSSASTSLRFGSMRVVDEGSQRRAVFDSCHNSAQGHHGIQRTVMEIQQREFEWPRMSRDVATWIAECAQCQKIRGKDPEVQAVPSPIGAVCIFEELSVDFVGPLPKDEVGNTYILNCVCSTTRYCELFAVEAATAVIAAHCLLSVVARYGCFRSIRTDRGSHFVNEVIEEFLRLFEIQAVLTLAHRPQANAIVERNGGEVMRHLRALVLDKVLRGLWSVLLPLTMRIINRSYKQSVGTTPHRLIHWTPTDLDRGLFEPFREERPLPAMKSAYVRALEAQYERLLDVTSDHILAEQEKIALRYVGVQPTEFAVGSYALVRYDVRAPSKLHCRWEGPVEIVSRKKNAVTVQDLTNGATHEYDVSRLRPFLVAPGVEVKELAAADMGEVEVAEVLEHRGSAARRAELEFLVRWTDGDETWESWGHVKKLTAIDDYIRGHPEAKLKSLLQKDK
jgi:hypothetical protein